MIKNSFHDFIVFDIFANIQQVTSRRMMGGWCIYVQSIPISIIVDDNWYIKTKDNTLIQELVSHGSQKFEYTRKNGKIITMAYWVIPEDLLDQREYLETIIERVLDENII